jgi:hypothetical protein
MMYHGLQGAHINSFFAVHSASYYSVTAVDLQVVPTFSTPVISLRNVANTTTISTAYMWHNTGNFFKFNSHLLLTVVATREDNL